MEIKSFAKLNLILNVLGKKDNGYHEVDFLMIPLELCDHITITESPQLKINNPAVRNPEDDLIYRAICKLKQITNCHDHYAITVNKDIPLGAGLGGGSSNATAVIKYIIEDQELVIDEEEMTNLLGAIGRDCPFFLELKPALVRGEGEEITPIDFALENPIIIVNPGIFVSTKSIFTAFDEQTRLADGPSAKEFIEKKDLNLLHNDLLEPALRLHEPLQKVYADLSKYNLPLIMAGSGSSFALIVNQNINTEALIAQLEEKYPYVRLTKMLKCKMKEEK